MTAVTPRPLRSRVLDAVAATVQASPQQVLAAPTLFDLPGFDSLAIVTVLETLEDELAVEVAPDRILPDAFISIDALTRLLDDALSDTHRTADPSGDDR
ncbi:phosphopantetheine-binding protein [Actinoplanes sp. HUAS TT8]|uniref:phosphopantetheine-binding protein n=1 Tax=Actinoplanes sp. HUAS TT8 TaxID=3447453 RepID=UPI003F52239E